MFTTQTADYNYINYTRLEANGLPVSTRRLRYDMIKFFFGCLVTTNKYLYFLDIHHHECIEPIIMCINRIYMYMNYVYIPLYYNNMTVLTTLILCGC